MCVSIKNALQQRQTLLLAEYTHKHTRARGASGSVRMHLLTKHACVCVCVCVCVPAEKLLQIHTGKTDANVQRLSGLYAGQNSPLTGLNGADSQAKKRNSAMI